MAYTTIAVDVDGDTAVITFDRPEVLNAVSLVCWGELLDCLEQLEGNDSVRFIVLTGRGRAFCAGGDLSDVITFKDTPGLFLADTYATYTAFLNSTKVTICAANGLTLGAGLILLTFSDLALAAESATFRAPEPLVGMAEPYLPATLPLALGMKRAKEFMFTCATLNAEEAREVGLVNDVVPDDDLMSHVQALIASMRPGSHRVLAEYKKVANSLYPSFDLGIVRRSLVSPDMLDRVMPRFDRRAMAANPTAGE